MSIEDSLITVTANLQKRRCFRDSSVSGIRSGLISSDDYID